MSMDLKWPALEAVLGMDASKVVEIELGMGSMDLLKVVVIEPNPKAVEVDLGL